MKNAYRINRGLKPGQYRLTDVFPDIRTYDILSTIFADVKEISEVMANITVTVVDEAHEMFVSNDDGTITIGLAHLGSSSDEVLYLDIVHELCHVKQHFQGRDLYDGRTAYVDRGTEIEAYQITVREARRIGLSDEAIFDYLRVPWITPEEHQRLARRLDVATGIREDDLL